MTTRDYEKKADGLIQEVCTFYGVCLMCGSTYAVGGHHIVKKGQCRGSRYWMRHDPRNLIPVCWNPCHQWCDTHPDELLMWLKENNQEVYKWRANQLALPMDGTASIRTTEYLRETIRSLTSLLTSLSSSS